MLKAGEKENEVGGGGEEEQNGGRRSKENGREEGRERSEGSWKDGLAERR